MKTRTNIPRPDTSGYALLMVLSTTALGLLAVAASMQRTTTVASLNDRNNEYTVNLNVAEAAVEKAYARLAYDFQAYRPAGSGDESTVVPEQRAQCLGKPVLVQF